MKSEDLEKSTSDEPSFVRGENCLHCPICATEPIQVHIEGEPYYCPNSKCELHGLDLLKKVFSISIMQERIESLERQAKADTQEASKLSEENKRLRETIAIVLADLKDTPFTESLKDFLRRSLKKEAGEA